MVTQEPTLFDRLPYEAQRDCAAEIPRLAGQNRRILERLLLGPVSNAELVEMANKYTGRISDVRRMLRRRGYDVEAYEHNRTTGVCWYRIVRWVK